MGPSGKPSDDLSPRVVQDGDDEEEEECILLPVPSIKLEDSGNNGTDKHNRSTNGALPPAELDVNQVVDRLLHVRDNLKPQASAQSFSPRGSTARVTFSARTSVVMLPDSATLSSLAPPSPLLSPRSRSHSTYSTRSMQERDDQDPGLLYMFIILYYMSAVLGVLVLVPLLVLKVRA